MIKTYLPPHQQGKKALTNRSDRMDGIAAEVCPDSLDMQCTLFYTPARPPISLALQLITPRECLDK